MASGKDQNPNLRDELDRRLFNLKTLYDVSHELLGLADVNQILKTFLLMTMGNFGVLHGFLALQDNASQTIDHLQFVGFEEENRPSLSGIAIQLLQDPVPGDLQPQRNAGEQVKSLVLGEPYLTVFVVDEACRGILGLGPKLVDMEYSEEDKELLSTLVNSLAVSLKGARYSEALEHALEEVRALNRAKDKVIGHLSHELMTPVALVGGSLTQLERHLKNLPEETWGNTLTRAKRAFQRLSEIQYEATDIMKGKDIRIHRFMSNLLDQCTDEIEQLFEEEPGSGPIVAKVRQRIDELFGQKETEPVEVHLHRFVPEEVKTLHHINLQRRIELITRTEVSPPIRIPQDVVEKVLTGLVRNAIENTPDEGQIEISVIIIISPGERTIGYRRKSRCFRVGKRPITVISINFNIANRRSA